MLSGRLALRGGVPASFPVPHQSRELQGNVRKGEGRAGCRSHGERQEVPALGTFAEVSDPYKLIEIKIEKYTCCKDRKMNK